jgi:hypothetical protein
MLVGGAAKLGLALVTCSRAILEAQGPSILRSTDGLFMPGNHVDLEWELSGS